MKKLSLITILFFCMSVSAKAVFIPSAEISQSVISTPGLVTSIVRFFKERPIETYAFSGGVLFGCYFWRDDIFRNFQAAVRFLDHWLNPNEASNEEEDYSTIDITPYMPLLTETPVGKEMLNKLKTQNLPQEEYTQRVREIFVGRFLPVQESDETEREAQTVNTNLSVQALTEEAGAVALLKEEKKNNIFSNALNENATLCLPKVVEFKAVNSAGLVEKAVFRLNNNLSAGISETGIIQVFSNTAYPKTTSALDRNDLPTFVLSVQREIDRSHVDFDYLMHLIAQCLEKNDSNFFKHLFNAMRQAIKGTLCVHYLWEDVINRIQSKALDKGNFDVLAYLIEVDLDCIDFQKIAKSISLEKLKQLFAEEHMLSKDTNFIQELFKFTSDISVIRFLINEGIPVDSKNNLFLSAPDHIKKCLKLLIACEDELGDGSWLVEHLQTSSSFGPVSWEDLAYLLLRPNIGDRILKAIQQAINNGSLPKKETLDKFFGVLHKYTYNQPCNEQKLLDFLLRLPNELTYEQKDQQRLAIEKATLRSRSIANLLI